MPLLLSLLAVVGLVACTGLPEPYLDPDGSETIHSVTEVAPGVWHVLVRVNYFSTEDAAERFLLERVEGLCPEGDAQIENLRIVGTPRLAFADVYCGERDSDESSGAEEEPTASQAPTEEPVDDPEADQAM